MLSPAQQHRIEVELHQKLAQQQAITIADGASMHLQAMAIERDIKRLRDLPTLADRIELKKYELLPCYLTTAERYLAEKESYRNPIFVYCIIWLFDVGEFDKALDWADIAIKQGQLMPFKSQFPAFVADQILAWSQVEFEAGRSIEPYFSRTFNNVTEKWKVHEKIVAKYYRFAGLMLLRNEINGEIKASGIDCVETLKKAANYLTKAKQFNQNIGVDNHLNRIAMRIRKLTEK